MWRVKVVDVLEPWDGLVADWPPKTEAGAYVRVSTLDRKRSSLVAKHLITWIGKDRDEAEAK